MITLRRYATYLALAVFTIITVTHFREHIASHARVQYASFFSSSTKHKDGRFHWADVPVYYPVKSLTALPTAKAQKLPKVQHNFEPEAAEHAEIRKERQAEVKATFQRCWKAYKEMAWMQDEVTPISGEYRNSFGGWAATLVDSLDTLWIMGLHDEFEEAVEAAMTIDLGVASEDTINVFETTIRHLGGFLSAYDLSGDKRLLEKAMEFGEMLLKAFDTPNRMPITRWKPQEALRNRQQADNVVLVAEIGSLTMEFTHLAQVSGDMRFYDAVDRIMPKFAKQQESTFLPGMWPVTVNGYKALFTEDTFFTLNAMSDSLYEYFPKMHALMGGTEPMYTQLYKRSMETAINHTIFKPMTPDDSDILISGNVRAESGSEPQLEPQGQHLGCFTGGMLALGGKLFNDDSHVNVGKKLTDGAIWTYRALPLGIMPEVFSMVACPSQMGECPWDDAKWKAAVQSAGIDIFPQVQMTIDAQRLPKGFTNIRDRRYILRPEAIESVFVLYRITGHEYLLHRAWEMFTNIKNASETPIANAALADVTYDKADTQSRSIKENSMESFWMAETLKYFYLIFSEPDLISLDEYVFNTEAHPFKRALP